MAEDKAAREELAAKYGRMATPTLIVGDKIFLGFRQNRDEIEEAIDDAIGKR